MGWGAGIQGGVICSYLQKTYQITSDINKQTVLRHCSKYLQTTPKVYNGLCIHMQACAHTCAYPHANICIHIIHTQRKRRKESRLELSGSVWKHNPGLIIYSLALVTVG